MKQLLLASTNPGKLFEIQALLAGIDLRLVTPDQIGLSLNVVEDGETYADNAELKARAFALAAHMAALADDSGLEVDCLEGAPGLYSDAGFRQ